MAHGSLLEITEFSLSFLMLCWRRGFIRHGVCMPFSSAYGDSNQEFMAMNRVYFGLLVVAVGGSTENEAGSREVLEVLGSPPVIEELIAERRYHEPRPNE